ncbi:MAG: FtsQ-type POTRA domain-containing protein [Syntrophorhabdales bacterium]|jgi:cell division protein FtsQ
MKRTLYLLFIIPMCLLSVLTGMYLFSRTEPVFLLKNIRIKGAEQLPESEILTKIYPFLKDSIFGTDMGKVKAAITSHPFVKDVRVKRVFPFSILIEVKERVPSALWTGPGGDIQMLDEDGAPYRGLYKGSTLDLLVISAKEKNDAKSIFREVTDWDRRGIIKKDDLSEVMYNEGNITLFSLNDGVEIILGKEERPERLKRAVAVLEDAKKRGLLIRCIDARFENGAIIKERKG